MAESPSVGDCIIRCITFKVFLYSKHALASYNPKKMGSGCTSMKYNFLIHNAAGMGLKLDTTDIVALCR